jgi:outer membrane protein insertion porin family
VRNNIADVTGSAEIDLNGTLSNPVVIGLVTLNEGGRVRFQNIDYNVVRGSINFQNPFRIDPYFDITLEGRVSGGVQELESGPVDVTVNLVGTLDRFTPSVTSDPPASDITLFSLLGVGGLFNRTGSNPSAPVDASLAGKSLLYQSLGSLVGSKILPFVDNFTIDPGLLDTSGDPGPKVAFERRLSNSVRLLVIYNLHDSKTRAVLEWQVNNDWTLQFTRDQIRTKEYRAEARFRRRYKGHWTFGGNGQPVTMFASLSPVEGSISDVQAAPALPKPPEEVPPPTGPLVREITYRADSNFDSSVLGQYVQLRPGEPLSVRAMQGTIKSLFATGDFRDVRIDTTPAEGGVAVTLLLFVNYRVADVTFDGLRGSLRDRAERELTVHLGDVLSLNAVDRSATAVHDYLSRNGYVEATVDPETNFIRQTSRATVIFHVTTGPRARVAAVNIEGDVAPFTTQELISQMKRGPEKTFTLIDARSDADRIAAYIYRHNYRKAEVRYLGDTYDATTHAATLKYSVTVGPIVEVAVEGVPRSAVRGLLPFRKNQGYSEDIIDTAANAIVKQYQEHGYYNAAVDTEGKLQGNVWTTTFHVAPGEQFNLAAVTFSGNQKIPDEKLRAVTTTAPSGGFGAMIASLLRRPRGVTKAQLTADRDSIESYYRLQGFSEATVATPVVNTDAAGHTLTVDFPIVEGPQTIVSAVTVEGNEQVPSGKLPALELKPGEPLNPALLRADLITLQTFYSDRGNAEVQITPRAEPSTDKTSAKVTYVIAEGPKISVDQVVVRGNTYTRTHVILTQSDIDKGDAFSYRSILEAQRNLYSLGIFQRVDIQAEQAGTSVADRNVTISVEEGKDLTVSGSVGLTSQSGQKLALLGSASVAHRNLFGTGRYLGLQLVAAGKQRQEAFLTYREPFIFGYDLPVQVTVFQTDEVRPRAHIQQRGTFIEATKIARFQTRWSARYEYKISDCIENPDTIADLCTQVKNALIPGLDRSITNVKISSFTPTFFWDRRDDSIDPHRGFFTSASVEYAFPVISATAHFLKEFAQVSYYLPVSQRSVFAVSTRIGLIQPFGKDPINGGPMMVPLSERFTAGGENSHRGFRLDLLGTTCADAKADPQDCRPTLVQLVDENGKPGPIAALGGSGLFITNIEYRFPIVSSLTGAVFADIGNIYHDSAVRADDLRYGAGAGIRYISPIGPLRFDIGVNPKPRVIGLTSKGDPQREDRYLYFITLGHAF